MTNIYSLTGKLVGEIELPKVFNTQYRPDLIQRAVVAMQASRRQVYGTDLLAGLRTSAEYFGSRRRTYRMTINKEIARLPKEKPGGGGLGKTRRIPQSVGGRRAHPPKKKEWGKKMNNKEYLFALKSAISAAANPELIIERGHKINIDKNSIPLVVEDKFESLNKTQEVIDVLNALGIKEDLERTEQKKVRAGRGKTRGRRYRQKKSALIVVNEDNGIGMAAQNIPGVDITKLNELDVELLAPGTHAGRVTLWTKSAIENLDKIM